MILPHPPAGHKTRRMIFYVENIRGAEKDVDKVLDAARLERHEGPNRHMTGEQKLILLLSLIAAGTFLTLLLAPILL